MLDINKNGSFPTAPPKFIPDYYRSERIREIAMPQQPVRSKLSNLPRQR